MVKVRRVSNDEYVLEVVTDTRAILSVVFDLKSLDDLRAMISDPEFSAAEFHVFN